MPATAMVTTIAVRTFRLFRDQISRAYCLANALTNSTIPLTRRKTVEIALASSVAERNPRALKASKCACVVRSPLRITACPAATRRYWRGMRDCASARRRVVSILSRMRFGVIKPWRIIRTGERSCSGRVSIAIAAAASRFATAMSSWVSWIGVIITRFRTADATLSAVVRPARSALSSGSSTFL